MVRDSLGVGIAVGVYGVAFGAASVAAGFTPAQTSVSSLLIFTGGSQFAVAGVLTGGGSALAALGSGYLLGGRNTLYALRLSSLVGARGWRRLLAAQLTIDESTAMALAQRDARLARLAFWWTAASIYLLWNLSTLAGAIGASALGDPRRFGLDAAIPAAFLALLLPQLKVRKPDQLNSAAADTLSGGAGARLAVGQSTTAVGQPADTVGQSPGFVGRSVRAIRQSVGVAVLAALIAVVLIPLTPPGVPVLTAGAALVVMLLRKPVSR